VGKRSRGVAEPAEKPAEGGDKKSRLMRVSTEFADTVQALAGMEKVSAAEFMDAEFLALIKKRYKDAILKEARRLGSTAT
jgi:hypothetical protein